MKKFKKITAVLLSVVMIVCCLSASVSAKSVFDSASKLEALELVSGYQKVANAIKEVYYKISLPDSGKLSFHCKDYTSSGWVRVYLYDTTGKTILDEGWPNDSCRIDKKGTYYIKIWMEGYYDGRTHYEDFYYSFEPDNTPTISLALNVKVGDELDFSALASNYSGKCTWKSTKPAVASVDKGKVKALKVGKAKIRAYMNNGDYAEITLVVKKK